MALSWASIASIVYGSLHVILLFAIGYIVYKQGTHEKIVSKSFVKDVWSQRKIYGTVLVHIYDCATDIAVLIIWFGLMQDELDGHDYEDVNMQIYFWTAFCFIILHRLVVLAYMMSEFSISTWYYPILALLDLAIFVGVYESITMAKQIDNAGNDTNEDEVELATTSKISSTLQENPESEKGNYVSEVSIGEKQKTIQFIEAAVESLPQVIVQSAFIIRSQNDEDLRTNNSGQWLLILSLIGSTVSVANKYRWVDDIALKDKYSGFKPNLEFPNCMNYWYFLPTIWRYCNTITRFTVFSLLWGVCGGYWIMVYILFTYAMTCAGTFCMRYVESNLNCYAIFPGFFVSILLIPGISDIRSFQLVLRIRWIDNIIAYGMIALFAGVKFDCNKCADKNLRHFGQNTMIDQFFTIGFIALIMDGILYVVSRHFKMWKK
eukprot:462288_1